MASWYSADNSVNGNLIPFLIFPISCSAHLTGMGFASRAGKLDQHSTSKPRVEKDKCVGCSSCVKYCPANAVKLVDRKAQINYEICIGCGQCIAVCQFGAMVPNWDASTDLLSRKMAEYAYAVLKDKRDRALYVSFIMDVSPNCDCWNVNDAPIVPNIGILASRDPVAIDQASVDLVNNEIGIENSLLKTNFKRIYIKNKMLGTSDAIRQQHVYFIN